MPTGYLGTQVEEILRGSFDLHVHAGPDPARERRLDALDTGRYAQESEMAGFVLKSHHYPTAPTAHIVSRVYPGLRVIGSITLNAEVGGLNPDAVQAAADVGAGVVWMPTHSAEKSLTAGMEAAPITLTDEAGKLKGEVHDILQIVRRHDIALASGHLAPGEALTLFRAAGGLGVQRLIATHPEGKASREELGLMASVGAYVEFTFLSCMPGVNRSTPGEMAAAIKRLGPERCVVSTDLGQWANPVPAEGMRMAIAALLDAGLTPDQVSTLVKGNPRKLVSLD